MPQSSAPNNSQQKSPLGELDFNRIIGGPLSACVNAQEEAAQATLEYLNGVVFRKKDGDPYSLEPVTVTFYFESAGMVNRLVMPLLCIVPVPYLQIEQVNLTFQATVTESSMRDNKLLLKAKYSAPGDSAEVTDVTKEEFKSKRCIDVNLCVTTADMPMGISKLIELFNNQLVEVRQDEPLHDPGPPDLPESPISGPGDTGTAPPAVGPAAPPNPHEEVKPEPEPPRRKYNIQLLGKPRKEQKVTVVNVVNSHCHDRTPLTGATLNNIIQSVKKTIPLETDLDTAQAIVKELSKKGLKANVVEVVP